MLWWCHRAGGERGWAPGVAPVPRGAPACLSEPPGTCGEYGCDLSCNHGGCQEVARVCPLGFSMVETANGIRCTGEIGGGGARGAAGGLRRSPAPRRPPSPPDIDECLSAACEGLCVNTEGGFVCECGPGMQLSADRHSCQGARGRGSGGGQRGRAGPAEPQPLPGRYRRVPGHAVPAPLQEQRGQLPLLLPARLPPPREPALLRG